MKKDSKRTKRRTKRRALSNQAQRKKVTFPTFLTDASVIVVILTGFTYLLGFVFKSHYLGYYGVNELRKDAIGSYYIANTFYVMFIIIFTGCLLYISLSILLIPLKEDKWIYSRAFPGYLLAMWILFVLDSLFDRDINDLTYQIIYGGITFLIILDYSFSKMLWYRNFINSINQRIVSFVTPIKNHKNFKAFALVFFLGGTFYFFELYGESSAAHQEYYLIIKNEPKDLVVIDHTKDKLLVAPVDTNKKIITPHYEIIESKSTKNEPLILESRNFKGGLKVKDLETY
ncbi:hypothetical protein ABE078_17880 [Priestia megaterium]